MAKKPVKKEVKKAAKKNEDDELDQANEEGAELEGQEQDELDEEDNVDSGDQDPEIEDEEIEDETPEEESEEPKKLLTCPKCHTKYDEDTMENKEAIVHGIKTDGEIKVEYYCPPCALSWLERSAAKLA